MTNLIVQGVKDQTYGDPQSRALLILADPLVKFIGLSEETLCPLFAPVKVSSPHLPSLNPLWLPERSSLVKHFGAFFKISLSHPQKTESNEEGEPSVDKEVKKEALNLTHWGNPIRSASGSQEGGTR